MSAHFDRPFRAWRRRRPHPDKPTLAPAAQFLVASGTVTEAEPDLSRCRRAPDATHRPAKINEISGSAGQIEERFI
jgi:hypothetical protein